MSLYVCQLTLHDNVFFATREMGILYETEKYLHNWALSYALFEAKYIPKPYRLKGETAQRPGYLDIENEQNLLQLNDAGIYVFPALPLRWSYQVNTFKAAQVNYYGKSKQFGDKGADKNYPINYGRAKELAVGSIYRTFLITSEEVNLPKMRWIRLGKWATKILVELEKIPDSEIQHQSGTYICNHPLNPIDLPNSTQLLLFNRIVMPPVSLVSQAQLSGDFIKIAKKRQKKDPHWSSFPRDICLPTGVQYGANVLTTAA
ncbi:MAG: type I-D CRISPR-associated protein Cas5/Csc1 [Thermosynechococcaceae cyanobacterium]